MAPLTTDLSKVVPAEGWPPRDKDELSSECRRWMDKVRSSKALTGAERSIGIAIAGYINKRSGHPWFGWAWPSYNALAEKTGYSPRTVGSAIKVLEQLGLILVLHDQGKPGRGGRTNRYTIRRDRLAHFEAAVAVAAKGKDTKSLPILTGECVSEIGESYENSSRKIGNLGQKDRKELLTTLSTTPLNDSVTVPTTAAFPADKLFASRKGRKSEERASSVDQFELAKCLGEGDVVDGYLRLGHERLDAAQTDSWALRLRKSPGDAQAIRDQFKALIGDRRPCP